MDTTSSKLEPYRIAAFYTLPGTLNFNVALGYRLRGFISIHRMNNQNKLAL